MKINFDIIFATLNATMTIGFSMLFDETYRVYILFGAVLISVSYYYLLLKRQIIETDRKLELLDLKVKP